MIPVLKWAGGKRWFLKHHRDLLTENFNRYIEPFVGSGAVFFHLEPDRALLGDSNKDLIDAYRALQHHGNEIEELLIEHHHNHSKEYYYNVRVQEPQTLIEGAARFIYLNRTCFNGIYRVNKAGNFNVPIGTRTSVLLPTDDFANISTILQRAELHVSDFEPLIDQATRGDLLFVDPPYTVRHNLNGFIKYNEILFSWEDQQRLAESLNRAKERGAKIVATNANHESVRNLYETRFHLQQVSRYSSISGTSDSRKQYEELIIIG